MTMGRPIPPLHLSDDERETLERWAGRRKTAQALAFRARLILACAEGKKNGEHHDHEDDNGINQLAECT